MEYRQSFRICVKKSNENVRIPLFGPLRAVVGIVELVACTGFLCGGKPNLQCIIPHYLRIRCDFVESFTDAG